VLVRYRVTAVGPDGATRFAPAEHDLRPTRSAYVHDKWDAAAVPLGFVLRGGPDRPVPGKGPAPSPVAPPGGMGRGPLPNFAGFGPRQTTPRPPRGSSAFVYVDPKAGKAEVFDHIHAVGRGSDRGFRVFFHKDQRLNGMSSVNLAFEGSEWSLMAEALAYDVYRRAGSPAPLTEFVRVWADGKLAGHHLLIERPNPSFLRRNKIDDSGNLYKILWMGRGVVGQHEKRTNEQTGHDDVVGVVDQLTKTRGDADAQWKVIRELFDVDQVATYFAVNTALSHWDGFFNNYFAYRDPKRGKWMMFPWDQDKTWGYYDGLADDQVFFTMPLTFGMAGDRPPAAAGGGFRGNWWRPGGHFSGPLLANPHFRKVFLARTRELLDKVYTKETYFPLIDETARRLGDEAALRAKLRGEPEAAGAKLLARDADLLKTHLVKRREFLLGQKELTAGGR
ncbi:MAG TPA: CotH kinase family protein, partial [Gemmataceae bacterium]|nr:CotH kinase family protein [Gemmataceae bacterium]